MRAISDTIARLAAVRAQPVGSTGVPGGRLTELRDFGSNPGNLAAWYHVPDHLAPCAPLVVVLHGCTQNAASYDLGSGWSDLADQHGFAVLFPEQRRANNPNLCFNWFEPADSRRGAGEPLSIVEMMEHMILHHGLDRSRSFVTGLSAGGAMTSVLLATYPDLFAGGAIIAGLPFGSASNIPQALERMRGQGSPGDNALAAAIRDASSHRGPWPTVSIWHGSADHVVAPSNADAILNQWRAVHGVLSTPVVAERVAGHARRTWQKGGRVVIEDYRITGMGHGTPVAAAGNEACGKAGPHMLEAGISSTRRIAHFWGLSDLSADGAEEAEDTGTNRPGPPSGAISAALPLPHPIPAAAAGRRLSSKGASSTADVGKIIEDALRAAGLMR